VSADEERTAIGDHRENEHYHHFTSYPLMEPRRQSKLLILYSDRVLMTHSDALVNVKASTLIRWHRQGFRLFWRWKSKPMHRWKESVYRGTSFAKQSDWSASCSPNTILTLSAMSMAILGSVAFIGELIGIGWRV